MDLLTHLCLPLTVAYAVRPGLFQPPWLLGLAGFALLPDFDKFLLSPGLLHSLLTLGPFCAGLLVVGWYVQKQEWDHPVADNAASLSVLVVALVLSHLVLDFVDGGPVPLLYPVVEQGLGLQYPGRTSFGRGPLGVVIEGAVVDVRTVAPNPRNRTYGFVQGAGVASLLAFVTVYVASAVGDSGGDDRPVADDGDEDERQRDEADQEQDGQQEQSASR